MRVAPIFEAAWAHMEAADGRSGGGAPLVFVRFDQAVEEAMPDFLDQLRGLDPPAEDTQFIDALSDDHEAPLADGAALVEAAAGGDEAAMATLERDHPVAEVGRPVRDRGMKVCGGDG